VEAVQVLGQPPFEHLYAPQSVPETGVHVEPLQRPTTGVFPEHVAELHCVFGAT
jgi:hypothetical protein